MLVNHTNIGMTMSSFIFIGCCAKSILGVLFKMVPSQIVEDEWMEILCDFSIYCFIIISAYRPDFTIAEKHKNLITLFDVAIPADKRILEKEHEKIMKYQYLQIELWNKLKMTKIIPMVIGTVGALSKHFHYYIKQLDLHS